MELIRVELGVNGFSPKVDIILTTIIKYVFLILEILEILEIEVSMVFSYVDVAGGRGWSRVVAEGVRAGRREYWKSVKINFAEC